MRTLSAAAALLAYGGIARTAGLRRRGVSERELARAVGAGEIIRIRKGVYASAGVSPILRGAAERGGIPGCTDAGRLIGLWILTETPGHVWVGATGTVHGDDRGVHWDAGMPAFGELPPVANVLLQIAACTDEETFFAALESALRWSLISPAGLAWLWHHLPVGMRELMALARSDADSGLESLVRLRLHRLGIRVRTQVMIAGVGEVDIQIGDCLLIECDGRENHERERQRHKDLWRDAAAAARGYQTLRFDYSMIVHHWPHVEAAILAVVRSGAHLRPAGRVAS